MSRSAFGERRRHPRICVTGLDVHLGLACGTIVDVSLGGLAIETSCGIRVGASSRLRTRVHNSLVEVRGRVRWSRLARTVRTGDGEVIPVFKAGISVGDGKALKWLLATVVAVGGRNRFLGYRE